MNGPCAVSATPLFYGNILMFKISIPALVFSAVLTLSLSVTSIALGAETDPADQAELGYIGRKNMSILKKIITKNLPRDIRVEAMDTFFFGLQGARIKGLKMTENACFLKTHPGIDPVFLNAENILVRINPLMLFLGQIYINEMRVTAPRYQIIRDREGNFNFDDLSEAQDSKLLNWLRIKDLTVNDGRYRVYDDSALDNPVTYTISDVDARINDFTIGKVFNLDVKAASPGSAEQNIFFKGKAGPMELNQKNEQIPVNADLIVVDLPILPYLGYSFPRHSPAKPISGLINIDFHLKGDAWSGMIMTGCLSLTDVIFRSAAGDLSGEPINLGMCLREPITLCLKDDLMEMKALDMIINDNQFTISGRMNDLKDLPRVDVQLITGDMDINVLTSAYPFILRAMPAELVLGGFFDMNVHLAGNQLDSALNGSLDLTGLSVDFADYFRKPADEPLSMDFTARVNTSELIESAGTFEMENFLLGHYNFIEDVLTRLLADTADTDEKRQLLADYHGLPHKIEKISGKVAYKDNRVRISDIKIVHMGPEGAAGIDAVVNGMVDFTDRSLDIKGAIIISEKLSRRIIAVSPKTAAFLSAETIVLGFEHTGTIDDFNLEIFPAGIRMPQTTPP